jgi:AraC-like DNA-binding protein
MQYWLVPKSIGGDAAAAPKLDDEIAVAPGVTVTVHVCTKPSGGWSPLEVHETYGLVFARRGSFRRRFKGGDDYISPAMAYFEELGAEDETLHPHDGGDTTSIFTLTEDAVSRFAGDLKLPIRPILTAGPIDFAHRRLIAAVRRGIDQFEAEERLTELVGALIETAAPGRLTRARLATVRSHDRIVDTVKEAIVANPAGANLRKLADLTGHSPFHVSRIFRRRAGVTLTQFRNRLRVTTAIELVEQGEPDLAEVALRLGFSDQAHMTRVVRAELGVPPGHVRRLLDHQAHEVCSQT